MVTKAKENKQIIIHTARSKHTRFLAMLCIILLIIIATLIVNFLTLNNKLQSSNEIKYTDVVSKVRGSVIAIGTEKTAGSGIIIENNGYILTNHHVISDV